MESASQATGTPDRLIGRPANDPPDPANHFPHLPLKSVFPPHFIGRPIPIRQGAVNRILQRPPVDGAPLTRTPASVNTLDTNTCTPVSSPTHFATPPIRRKNPIPLQRLFRRNLPRRSILVLTFAVKDVYCCTLHCTCRQSPLFHNSPAWQPQDLTNVPFLVLRAFRGSPSFTLTNPSSSPSTRTPEHERHEPPDFLNTPFPTYFTLGPCLKPEVTPAKPLTPLPIAQHPRVLDPQRRSKSRNARAN